MSAPNNPLAFPETPADCNGYAGSRGMSLRDWFAGQALTGMFASEAGIQPYTPDWVADRAYLVADAMLAIRDGSTDAEPLPQTEISADPLSDIDPDCASGVSVADHNGVSCIECYLPF